MCPAAPAEVVWPRVVGSMDAASGKEVKLRESIGSCAAHTSGSMTI